jgi:NAD+ kinase
VSGDVALIYQPFRPETHLAAQRCAELLRAHGVAGDLLQAMDLTGASPAGYRLAITFGGDGTALRGATWLAGTRVPVVPVRMGRLSFLGELEEPDLSAALPRLLEGRYRLDERAMLETSCNGVVALALNEAIVGRGAASRAIRVDTLVDGELLTRYTADGVVLATPTGSTAYALAAGGPILAPALRAMVLVPVAPHLTQVRALVLPDDVQVELVVHTIEPAVLTIDGHLDHPVEDGQSVRVRRANRSVRFARVGSGADFYRLLEARLSRRRE